MLCANTIEFLFFSKKINMGKKHRKGLGRIKNAQFFYRLMWIISATTFFFSATWWRKERKLRGGVRQLMERATLSPYQANKARVADTQSRFNLPYVNLSSTARCLHPRRANRAWNKLKNNFNYVHRSCLWIFHLAFDVMNAKFCWRDICHEFSLIFFSKRAVFTLHIESNKKAVNMWAEQEN